MLDEDKRRYSTVLTECAKTSTELLSNVRKIYTQLQDEKEREARVYFFVCFTFISACLAPY